MLSPQKIEGLREQAARMTDSLTDFLMQDIARRISGAGQLTSSAAYQIYRAQQLGLSRKEIEARLRKEMKVSHKKLRDLLTQSAEVGYRFDLKQLSLLAIPFEKNTSLQQMVDAAVKLAQKGFTNLTQTLGMVAPDGKAYPLQKTYQKAMDFAFQQVFTGVTDSNTAIRQATKNIADYGVRTIDYQSGVHTSLEAAVRRNVMGGLGLMQEQISTQNHDAFGANGWEISAHSASAPDHENIQGKQYSDAEFNALNASLKRRIGTLNCGHAAFPIILGVNEPQYSAGELAAMKQKNAAGVSYEGKHYSIYEATQQQRRIERTIRKQKTRCLVDDAASDAEKLTTDQIRLGQLRDAYKHFSKTTGLPMLDERLYVAGFGRSQGARAGAAHQKVSSTPEGSRSSKSKGTPIPTPDPPLLEVVVADNNPSAYVPEPIPKHLQNEEKGGILKAENDVETAQSIDSPIEQRHTGKGNPNAILQVGTTLNLRQSALLDRLKEYDSRTTAHKKEVRMSDLSALTAETGMEYAMFTKGRKRLIVRGSSFSVNIDEQDAKRLAQEGYHWSGHTHPGFDGLCMTASDGDKAIIQAFGQMRSVIYNSKGQWRIFERE